MIEELEGKLDPRIKAVWRISDALWVSIVFAIAIAPGLIALSSGFDGAALYCGVVAAVYAVLLLLFLVVITPLRYLRWRYHLEPGFLRIVRGIFWRTTTVVPFIRVQNTDTKQGPILRAFGLASVTVSTAAGAVEIPGLASDEADAVRDRAAEFARIAREDV